MSALRLLLAQRHVAALICACALLMKVAVPGGYMVSNVAGSPAIILCPQVAAMPPASGDMTHAGMSHAASKRDGKSHEHGKVEMPCVFTALAAATLAATDPLLLASLIAYVMALAIAGVAWPRPAEPARSRPPLRGPPILL